MKYFIIILAVIVGCKYIYSPYTLDEKNAYLQPYTTVYGRDSCSVTNQTLAYMNENNIEYIYRSVDDESTVTELHRRMEKQDISTRRYNLPVVDFSGELMVRPNKKSIIDKSNG